jgi:hypothetical protein
MVLRRGGNGGHGVALLRPASDEDGARGVPARSKLSTMIILPPQQGHDGRWSVAARCASSRSVGVPIGGSGGAINCLARAILALQVALASSP